MINVGRRALAIFPKRHLNNLTVFRCFGVALDPAEVEQRIIDLTQPYTRDLLIIGKDIEFEKLTAKNETRELDGLDRIEILVDVEQSFGVIMDDSIADSLHSVKEATNWIVKNVESQEN
eukprot:Platyproteum_vivax@DN5183_c0_g1_i1.p2